MRNAQLTRRGFLKASAAAALAAPRVIPSEALRRDGAVAPSNRIVVGSIGTGGRGQYDPSVPLHERDLQFVAVCDVQKNRREQAKKAVDDRYGNGDCACYADFRDLLGRRNLDAVQIATGDRWHTPLSIMAMKSGRDVFCEKPCTMTVAAGQELVATAQRYGRIFQAGHRLGRGLQQPLHHRQRQTHPGLAVGGG
ncbi:MAG: Gfo/Idh/MocA family oxidoreductase, partial [Planctomycetota bacterium]|nr:Gfo/Idh/MocA family oxidoreductase [Planctomycetota bacterium]